MCARRNVHGWATTDPTNFAPLTNQRKTECSRFLGIFLDSRYRPTSERNHTRALQSRAHKMDTGSAAAGSKLSRRQPVGRTVRPPCPVLSAHPSPSCVARCENDVSALASCETTADHRFTECVAFAASKVNVTGMSFPDGVYERSWTATTTGISFRTWNWETNERTRRNARFARIDGSRGSAPKLQQICNLYTRHEYRASTVPKRQLQ